MAMSAYDEIVPIVDGVFIVAADGTAQKSLTQVGFVPYRVDSIKVTSTAAAARFLKVEFYIAGGWASIANILIPAGSGVDGIPPVDILATQGIAVQGVWLLTLASALAFSISVALTGGEKITAVVFGGFV